jgi:serine/threonine protein kinase
MLKVEVETAFNTYRLLEQLGEGGAGRVYSGIDLDGTRVAVKVLTSNSKDKKKRFKNETAFLLRQTHKNIVTVTDFGIANDTTVKGPFYVMAQYDSSLRNLIESGLAINDVMPLFSKILDGVEAAHLLGVTHRDLKPENILIKDAGNVVVVADFGIASFTEEFLHTLIDTAPTTRLANFQYAAPEQRIPGQYINSSADIYALGLMLNELFTRSVPHGTEYQKIGTVTSDYGFLDSVVDVMIRQNAAERPKSVAEVKGLIQKYRAEAVSLQKLRILDSTVIPVNAVDEPLAHQPPQLIGAEYRQGTLYLELDRPVNDLWVNSFKNMSNYTSVMGIPPSVFRFNGRSASVGVSDSSAQQVIDFFKDWLLRATTALKFTLEQEAKRRETSRIEKLHKERETEQRTLEINRRLRI